MGRHEILMAELLRAFNEKLDKAISLFERSQSSGKVYQVSSAGTAEDRDKLADALSEALAEQANKRFEKSVIPPSGAVVPPPPHRSPQAERAYMKDKIKVTLMEQLGVLATASWTEARKKFGRRPEVLSQLTDSMVELAKYMQDNF